jgi:hypothetical protein
VFECVRMRDADGARLATIELLEIAARDLDSKRPGLRSAPRVWRRAERFGLTG